MLSLIKKNKKAPSSILSGQKPRKRRSRSASDSSTDRKIPLAAVFALFIALAFVLWRATSLVGQYASQLQAFTHSALQLPPKDWSLQVVDGAGVPLNDELRQEVYKTVSKALKNNSPIDLSRLTANVSSLGLFEQVVVVRPQYQTLIVTATIRQPVLSVSVGGRSRYLAQDGTIYGDMQDQHFAAIGLRPSIEVTGVFDERTSPVTLDSSQKAIISSAEKNLLLNAISLWRLTQKSSLQVRKISYQNFRGFGVNLEGDSDIILGQAPFEYKLDKLIGILGKLKSQGITASRIELDYDGKAFIKERKI